MMKDPATEASQLNRVYAWFAALVKEDAEGMDDLLAHGVPVDVPHPLRHTTALMEATRLGRTAMVHWLLDRGATPAFLCGLPQGSPMHAAIRLHHWHIAAMLVDAAQSAGITDHQGRTPLHMLALETIERTISEPMLKLAGMITGKHCPIDALDREGLSALHYAVINDHPPLTEVLLKLGANPNIRVPDSGMTPLAVAALDKNTNLASLLIHYGANPYQHTRDGASPATILPALSRMVAGVSSKPN